MTNDKSDMSSEDIALIYQVIRKNADAPLKTILNILRFGFRYSDEKIKEALLELMKRGPE